MTGGIFRMSIDDQILANPILHQLKERYEQNGETEKLEILYSQTVKGIAQYGHTVNPKEFTVSEWRKMHLEELVDADVYELCEQVCKTLEESQNARD